MGRPIYPYDLADPDFAWLLSTFLEQNQNVIPVEESYLPLIYVRIKEISVIPGNKLNIPQVEAAIEPDLLPMSIPPKREDS